MFSNLDPHAGPNLLSLLPNPAIVIHARSAHTKRMEDLSRLPTENLNVRYLAWKQEPNPGSWVDVLHKATSFPVSRAREILLGSPLTAKERASIVEGFAIDADEFGTARLFGMAMRDILMANVSYLMRGLPQGEQKRMAAKIGVAKETVSRWAKGRVPPNSGNVRDILRYLQFESAPALAETPLFLSIQPVGQHAQRDWLKKRLEALPAQELGRLFPALEKLFGEYEDR